MPFGFRPKQILPTHFQPNMIETEIRWLKSFVGVFFCQILKFNYGFIFFLALCSKGCEFSCVFVSVNWEECLGFWKIEAVIENKLIFDFIISGKCWVKCEKDLIFKDIRRWISESCWNLLNLLFIFKKIETCCWECKLVLKIYDKN